MSSSSTVWKHDLIASLNSCLSDYNDLAPPDVTILHGPPSSLDALRMLHANVPCVIKGFSPLKESANVHDWTRPGVYEKAGGERKVGVAVTDDGLADSVKTLSDGSDIFVKPFNTRMSIPDLIKKLGKQKISDCNNAYYLQSQDGNIYRDQPHLSGPPDLSCFQEYIERDIDWMKEAVGKEAEAVNLWIGDKRSTTSFHHDPYENIYHVLAGTKTFTLLSPLETIRLDQHFYPPYTLAPESESSERPLILVPTPDSSPAYPIPWVASPFIPPRSRHFQVKLEVGDTLYLPAGWWHMVEQDEEDGWGVAAINYWYSNELHPQTFAYENLLRRLARMSGLDGVIPPFGDEIEKASASDDDERVDESIWG